MALFNDGCLAVAAYYIRQWWVIVVRKWVFLVKWWVKESPLMKRAGRPAESQFNIDMHAIKLNPRDAGTARLIS